MVLKVLKEHVQFYYYICNIYLYLYIVHAVFIYLLMSVVSLFNQATSCLNRSNLFVLIFTMFYYIITYYLLNYVKRTTEIDILLQRGKFFTISLEHLFQSCIIVFLKCLLHSPVSHPSMIILSYTSVKSFLGNPKFIFCSLLSFCCL